MKPRLGIIRNSLYLIIPLFIGGLFVVAEFVKAQSFSVVQSEVKINVCGNLHAEPPAEECDNYDLQGLICDDFGYNAGNLSCDANCNIDTSDCYTDNSNNNNNNSGGGGGGGGGTPPAPQSGNSVTFSGRAYPLSDVTLLKDAQIVAHTVAGPDSKFSISLSNISSGDYIFSVYGTDLEGRRSSLFTFNIFVSQNAATNVSGIYVAPTIGLDKSQVRQGDNVAIFGQSVPNSRVTIGVHSEGEHFLTTTADEDGVYLYNFDSSQLEMGSHVARSKSSYDDEASPFSSSISFVVGDKNIVRDEGTCGAGVGDLNCDGSVNLVDFSIMAYWYQRSGPPANVDLNDDNKVTIVDFSILAYYWTG